MKDMKAGLPTSNEARLEQSKMVRPLVHENENEPHTCDI